MQMSKPLLDNNAKAKADFKARLDPDTSFELKISGWQLADSNYVEAETTLAITVSSEGVLSCGEPTCSAASRTFGTTPTTRSLFSAHKHAVAFHPPLRRALHVFARGGSAKRAMLSQPTIAKSSSPIVVFVDDGVFGHLSRRTPSADAAEPRAEPCSGTGARCVARARRRCNFPRRERREEAALCGLKRKARP